MTSPVEAEHNWDNKHQQQGPSIDWERHKDTIIALYNEKTLKEVVEHMKQNYGVDASERMYKTRLGNWGSKKYNKSKDRMVSRPAQSGMIAHGRPGAAPPILPTNNNAASNQIAAQPRSRQSSVALQTAATQMTIPPLSQYPSPASTSISPSPLGAVSLQDQSKPRSPRNNSEEVVASIRKYYKNYARIEPEHPTTRDFWPNLKQGLDLLHGDPNSPTGLQTIKLACDDTREVVLAQPYDFLRQMVVTLSPPHVQALPQLRNQILRYISGLAVTLLDQNHPIGILCDALKLDDRDMVFARQALTWMIECVQWDARVDKIMEECQLRTDLVKLARQSGQIELAEQEALALFGYIEDRLQHGSLHCRKAGRALAQVYQAKGQLQAAYDFHLMALNRPGDGAQSSVAWPYYSDDVAVSSLQDLADVVSAPEDKVQWLEKAESLAGLVFGQAAATTKHIRTKLEDARQGLMVYTPDANDEISAQWSYDHNPVLHALEHWQPEFNDF